MNAVIKSAKNKKMDVADCIENLRKEVNHQQSMKKLAMISRGELFVSEKFSSLISGRRG
jgi:predicted thioredoxin/glutaredoxin